jgi:hypothetical protein
MVCTRDRQHRTELFACAGRPLHLVCLTCLAAPALYTRHMLLVRACAPRRARGTLRDYCAKHCRIRHDRCCRKTCTCVRIGVCVRARACVGVCMGVGVGVRMCLCAANPSCPDYTDCASCQNAPTPPSPDWCMCMCIHEFVWLCTRAQTFFSFATLLLVAANNITAAPTAATPTSTPTPTLGPRRLLSPLC